MQLILRSLLILASTFVASCSLGHQNAELQRRDGPPFAESFSDIDVLVTTTEVRETRALLATTPLPDTKEHQESLLALLARTEELATEHLLLLTEAVALDHSSSIHTFNSSDGHNTVSYWGRGTGEQARVVDELLLNGVRKVRDPSPENLGKLLGKTQTKEAVVALAEGCASMKRALDWDDGSDSDLELTLKHIPTDQIRTEYCIEALLPNGHLSESRAEIALNSLSFDSGRQELIAADYARRKSLSASVMLRHAKMMSFDSGRIAVVEHGSPLLSTIDGAEALEIVHIASFDSGRKLIIEQLAAHIEFRSSPDLLAIVKTASFDSGRAEILTMLTEDSRVRLSGSDLLDFMQVASFDSGRLQLMTTLQPHLDSPMSADELSALLATSSFDSGRLQIAKVFKSDLSRVPNNERDKILSCFSMDGGKSKLRELLDW